jgi:hypothetical protein
MRNQLDLNTETINDGEACQRQLKTDPLTASEN